ncbi:MAG: aldo/keto reductase [Bacteroidales bacterium]|nr:aldo/keto reductase [Bacteroidales bacterium]
MKQNITRKDFLKAMGATAAVTTIALSGCKSKTSEQVTTYSEGEIPKDKMTYRTNRNSGDRVSILGYGCMRLPHKDNVIDQEMVNKLTDFAMEHGVNYYDTAPVYCKGKSEEAMGIALSRYPRDKYFIATKLSNFAESTWSREASMQIYKNSFENLKTDYIDYYLLHSVGNGSRNRSGWETFNLRYIENGMLDFLMEERKAGRIRNLGFSFHGDQRVIEYLLDNQEKYHWDFVQIQMNYVDWKHAHTVDADNINADYLYQRLTSLNIPVVIMEPLLGGRLSDLPDVLANSLRQRTPERSVASWAFRFAGTFPNILTVLSGMTYMEHLQDNLKTYCPMQPCSDKEIEMLMNIADMYLKYPIIPCTSCQYCMPCPYGIDIPTNFSFYNKCVNEGTIVEDKQSAEYRKSRRRFLIEYNRQLEADRQTEHCIGCRQCMSHCPQHIDIPARLSDINAIVERMRRE